MEEREFKCPECEKILYSEEALRQHNEAKHGKKEEKKKRNLGKKIYVPFVIALILLVAYISLSAKAPEYEIKTPDEDHVLGDINAPVEILEFSDFQCPFCARFSEQTKPLIEENYIKNGKVKLVFKHYVIPSHTNAQKAAEASECAADIGGNDAFWKMHDKMFQNNEVLTISNIKKYAREIGLNGTEFDACLDSGVMRIRVQKDMNEGNELRVSGTPAFFILREGKTQQRITGAQPYSVFKSAIDEMLK